MKRIVRNLLLDLLAAGLALTVFALFHHVLPRKQESLNIQTAAPAGKTAEGNEAAAAVPTEEPETISGTEETVTAAAETESSGISADAEQASFRPTVLTSASTGKSDTYSRMSSSGKGRNKNGKNGMNSKGGSALAEDSAASGDSTETADSVPIADKFSDFFTDTVVLTENSYSSPDLSITVSEMNEGSLTYYVADIYVRDITCFQTALASDTYGSGFRDSIEKMAVLNNALLAVNGDYYGNTNEGVVIRNGVIYRANPTDCDICALYYDGSMKVMPGSSFSMEEAIEDGAWQAWTFGPALLDSRGEPITAFSSTNRIISANPRTAIGYYEPGHYCLVVVDGRGESSGITLPALSRLFYDLGCSAAYNLDGGNSSIMVWGDKVINNPSGGGRESSDALLLTEVRDYE